MADPVPKTLSFRADMLAAGLAEPHGNAIDELGSATRVLLLVHGFNNSAWDGWRAYGNFWDDIRPFLPDVGAPDLVVYLFWPGNSDRIGPLCYTWRIGTAKAVGARLAELLQRVRSPQRGPIRLSIVGHSLGCRVVLEFLVACGQHQSTLLDYVALMAAAVPHPLLEKNGPLELAAAAPRRLRVLFSIHDWVLRRDFVLGQSLAGASEWGEAIGLHGFPFSRRTPRPHGIQLREVELEHSQYWSGGDPAEQICADMAFKTPATISKRRVPKWKMRCTRAIDGVPGRIRRVLRF